MRRFVAGAAALVAAIVSLHSPGSWAQDAYPSRPVRIVVGFAAGGTTDILARLIAAKLGENTGKTFLIENKPGAAGNLGADYVAKSAPDGYSLLMATGAFGINPSLYKSLPFDPINDFQPVSIVVSLANVLVVHPSLPATNLRELTALLKAEPGKYGYATSGIGTPLHLSGELFKQAAGVDIAHVPYKGSGPALNDLAGGHVPMMFDALPSAIGFIRAGKVRAIAVTTATRSEAMPELPTMAEGGLPGYATDSWNALLAPAKTPAAIVAWLNTEVNRALRTADLRQKLAELSADVRGTSPEEAAAHVRNEIAKWAPVVNASGAGIE